MLKTSHMTSDSPSSLFVWRGKLTVKQEASPGSFGKDKEPYNEFLDRWGQLYGEYESLCPFCHSPYTSNFSRLQTFFPSSRAVSECPVCGFQYGHDMDQGMQDYWTTDWVAAIQCFELNHPEVTLSELCTHLARQYSDVYALSWNRFEEVVAEVMQSVHGFRACRTIHGEDRACDIILLERTGGERILVECKKYAQDRTVGISVVRHLLGVLLLSASRRAKLVTCSHFSRMAIAAANDPILKMLGMEINLVDAEALMRDLNAFNEAMPPLGAHAYFSAPVKDRLR